MRQDDTAFPSEKRPQSREAELLPPEDLGRSLGCGPAPGSPWPALGGL